MPYGRPGTSGGASIGGTVTGGTTGSVLFIGAAAALAQDNANFFWNDTNNRLGIGNNAPAQALDITGNIALSGAIELGNAADTTLARAAAGRASIEGIAIVRGPGAATDNAVARFDATTGDLIQNSSFLVDDSGNVSSFGGNITFPAVQAASAGANTLDDYEEGTWTPTDASGAGLSLTIGGTPFYNKIGREITGSAEVVYPVTADVNLNLIGGWPFTSATNNSVSQGVLSFKTVTAADRHTKRQNATTSFTFDNAGIQMTNAQLSGGQLNFQCCYI